MSKTFRGLLEKKEDPHEMKRGLVASVFLKEIETIESSEIRTFTREILMHCTPDYFWEMPASTSGKYHNPDESADGTLARKHVKRVFNLAKCIMASLGWFSHTGDRLKDERKYDHDVILSACLLHDILRCGFAGRERKKGGKVGTDALHPYYVREVAKWHKIGETRVYNYEFFDDIMKAVEGHYGYWSSVQASANLENAQSREFIVCMADYIASRKTSEWLDV